MATNKVRWLYNLNGATAPLVARGNFAAGATQAIKKGEILELTGSSNTQWVPIDSDFAMAGDIAIANEEIKSGDLAGYYEIIVPRPDDVFEFDLATATALSVGADLFYSSSEAVTTTGSFKLGQAVGEEHYPRFQRHMSDGVTNDSGTTISSTSYARMTFAPHVSYYAKLQQQNGSALLYTNVADSAAVTNTTTETAFDKSYTIKGSLLEVGDVIRIRAKVKATATNGTDTLTIKAKVGTEVVATTGALDVADNDLAYIDVDVVVRAIGASGKLSAAGIAKIGGASAVPTIIGTDGEQTEDISGNVAVTITATWSVANAGNSCLLRDLIVEHKRRGSAL